MSIIVLDDVVQHTPKSVKLKWKVSKDLAGLFDDNEINIYFDENVSVDDKLGNYIFSSVILPAYCRTFNQKGIAVGIFEGMSGDEAVKYDFS